MRNFLNTGILMISTLTLFLACSGVGGSEKRTSGKTDSLPELVMQIKKCSRLYTSEYHIHKIVTHDDALSLKGSVLKQDFDIDIPIGKRKIAIPMDATVKACIDFSDFSEKNVRRDGDKVEIILPDPEIVLTSSKIDHDGIRQYVALLRSDFSDEELSSYERQGRKAIIAQLPKMGIVGNARDNAARVLIPLFEQLGYKEENITVTFRKQFKLGEILKDASGKAGK